MGRVDSVDSVDSVWRREKCAEMLHKLQPARRLSPVPSCHNSLSQDSNCTATTLLTLHPAPDPDRGGAEQRAQGDAARQPRVAEDGGGEPPRLHPPGGEGGGVAGPRQQQGPGKEHREAAAAAGRAGGPAGPRLAPPPLPGNSNNNNN